MPRREVEIEKQLTEHIQKFLLELGQPSIEEIEKELE